jgi:hypothetical protein
MRSGRPAGPEGAGSDPGPLSLADQRDGPVDPYMQVPGGSPDPRLVIRPYASRSP